MWLIYMDFTLAAQMHLRIARTPAVEILEPIHPSSKGGQVILKKAVTAATFRFTRAMRKIRRNE
jgi:hypothetical protein